MTQPFESAPSDRSGWVPLLALSSTVAVSFGVLLYAVSVMLTQEAAGSVFSTTVLSVGYGGALLVGGLLAPLVGSRADRFGVRLILFTGIALGGLGISALSVANRSWHVLAIFWLLIGPAGSMTFYEPAFIAVEQWFGAERRARSLATLTLVGGLAGPIFLPLSSALVDGLGWRSAARVLAAILVAVGGPAAVLMAHTLVRQGGESTAGRGMATLRVLLRDRRLVVYTASVALMFLCVQAILLHRIALFEEGGFAVATAAAGAAVASLLSFPGRLAAPFMARKWGGIPIQVAALLVLAGAAAVSIDGSQTWQLVAHFLLFGTAFGAMLPIRASIMGAWYSGPSYGRIMGSQWLVVSVAGAFGPAAIGALRDIADGYATPMGLVTAGLLASAALAALSGRILVPAVPGPNH